MQKMTMRERMLAVIQGREHDRVPFAMYEIMLPAQEAFDLLGHGNIGMIRFCSIFRAATSELPAGRARSSSRAEPSGSATSCTRPRAT